MKVLLINGSPKGEYSITLQTVRYLEQQYPQQTFEVLHVGQKIKALEQDLRSFDVGFFLNRLRLFLCGSQIHIRSILGCLEYTPQLQGGFRNGAQRGDLKLLILQLLLHFFQTGLQLVRPLCLHDQQLQKLITIQLL